MVLRPSADFFRFPSQIVPGNETVQDPIIFSLDTVMESGFSVAVRIDHLFGPILFSNLCKRALILQNVCRRIVQEHQILSISTLVVKVEMELVEAHLVDLKVATTVVEMVEIVFLVQVEVLLI